MSTMQLKVAQRMQVYLKLNLSGPAGSGKTKSALRMAYGMVGDWSKIAVIDSENGSASLYSDMGPFLTIDLKPPFTPERYEEAVDACIKAGMLVTIIDSSSHEWSGPGGCLEINEALASAKYRGNTWSAWNETTPRHDSFVQKVLQARCHIITCTRSKMETVMTDDKKVKKVGMKDIQREGWEYDLTVSLLLDRDTHTAIASKDRTNVFEKMPPFIITEETGRLIKEWCEKGIDPAEEERKQLAADIEAAKAKLTAAENLPQLGAIWTDLPANVQAACFEVKESLKAALTPPSPTELEIAAAKARLIEAPDFATLSEVWAALSPELKTACLAVKDHRKVELQTTPATT